MFEVISLSRVRWQSPKRKKNSLSCRTA